MDFQHSVLIDESGYHRNLDSDSRTNHWLLSFSGSKMATSILQKKWRLHWLHFIEAGTHFFMHSQCLTCEVLTTDTNVFTTNTMKKNEPLISHNIVLMTKSKSTSNKLVKMKFSESTVNQMEIKRWGTKIVASSLSQQLPVYMAHPLCSEPCKHPNWKLRRTSINILTVTMWMYRKYGYNYY